MRRLVGVMTVVAAICVACGGSGSKDEAQQAVRVYVDRMAEAYRKADISPVDPLVGDEHGRRLLGLIGVKSDLGVALDARLLSLEFTRTERKGEGWVVETKERWYYADRKLRTGEQVGRDSMDSYAMRYTFSRAQGRLILDDLAFIEEPVVGRKPEAIRMDTRVMHGLPPAEPGDKPAERKP